MRHIPSPTEVKAVNVQRQRDAAERLSQQRADSVLEEIVERLEHDGVPSGGMRYQVPQSCHRDYSAVDAVVRQLTHTGWKVLINPDDEEDDICHHRTATNVLLIRFP